MAQRQAMPGKRPALAACMAFAAVRLASPLLTFTAAPPPGVGVQRWAPVAVAGSAEPAAGPSSTAAFALAACAAAGAAALSASVSRSRPSRSTSSHATALKACFDADVSCALPPAEFRFAGAAAGLRSQSITSKVTRHLLMPKNIKWKKPHKPSVQPYGFSNKWKYRGQAYKGHKPHFGKYALQVMEEAWVKSKNIEDMRRLCVQTMERKGKLWIRVFPHQAITKRTAESRMGAGKGTIDSWVAAVRPGFILFEMDAVPENIARLAFMKCEKFMPFKTRFIIKNDGPSMFELGLAGVAGKKATNIPLEFQKGASDKKGAKVAPKAKPKAKAAAKK